MPHVTIHGVALKQQDNGSYKLRCHVQYNKEPWEVHEEVISEEKGKEVLAMDPLQAAQFVAERLP